MVSVKLPIYGLEDTFIRPVLIKVLDDIKESFGMKLDAPLFLDERDKFYKNKSAITGKIKAQLPSYVAAIRATYEETTDDDCEISNRVRWSDHLPIFADREIDAVATPIHLKKKYLVNVRYYNKSKNALDSLLNNLRISLPINYSQLSHTLEYSYVLPTYMLELIAHFNTLKNLRLVTPVTTDDYLTNHMDERLDLLMASDGALQKTSPVIREAQNSVLGNIEQDIASIKIETDSDLDCFYIEFQYLIALEKPVFVTFEYPILVYNTRINKVYRNFTKPKKIQTSGASAFGISPGGELATNPPKNQATERVWLCEPEEDYHRPPIDIPGFVRMLSILVIVDPLNPKVIFNLDDLTNIKFKDAIKNYIKTEGNNAGVMGNSLIYLELLKNGDIIDNNPITIDSNGNLSSTIDMDIKSTYRVSVSVMYDLAYLKPTAKDRLRVFLKTEYDELRSQYLNTDTYTTFMELYTGILSIPVEQTVSWLATTKYYDLVVRLKDVNWSMVFTQAYYTTETYLVDRKD